MILKKILLPMGVLLAAGAVTMTAGDAPRVSRSLIVSTEKSLDKRLGHVWEAYFATLLGDTRGIYLDGYGAVFTAELNLAPAPISAVQPTMSKEDRAKYHQMKLERLPQLRKLLKQALTDSAASLDPVPGDEQIVISVYLWRLPSEDTTGIPVQITMQAQKKRLLEAQRSNGAGLDDAIRVTEY